MVKSAVSALPIFHTIQVEPILYMIYAAKSYLLDVYLWLLLKQDVHLCVTFFMYIAATIPSFITSLQSTAIKL